MRTSILACVLICGCGSSGPPGPPGKDGTNGEAGATGSSAYVAQSIYCVGFANVNNAEQYMTYEVETFSDQGVFVSATVSTTLDQSSGAMFFAPGQQGYETGPIAIILDVIGPADSGTWSLSMDRSPGQTVLLNAVYSDQDLQNNPYTVQSSSCTVKNYPNP